MDRYKPLWLQENTQEGKNQSGSAVKPGKLQILCLAVPRNAQQVKSREQDLPGYIPTKVSFL